MRLDMPFARLSQMTERLRAKILEGVSLHFTTFEPFPTLLNGNNRVLNMEKKNWKAYLRKLGWAGVIFFTVKGTITLFLGAWIVQKLGCGP